MLYRRCALMLCLSPEICKFYVCCNILSSFRLREIMYDGDLDCVSEECTPATPPSPLLLFLVLNAVNSSIVTASFTKISQPLIQYKFVRGENNVDVITERQGFQIMTPRMGF
jgi:hypothetical protein